MTIGTLAPREADLFKIVNIVRQLCERTNGGREVLSADRTYYVATTGSDTNEGTASTTPFLTIQKAINTAYALDGRTFNITINIADGTYSENVLLGGPFQTSGTVKLIGNTTTPANVIIQGSGSNSLDGALTLNAGAKLSFGGFRLRNTSGSGLVVKNGSFGDIINQVDFSAVTFAHIYVFGLSGLKVSASFSHTASTSFGILTQGDANMTFFGNNFPITVTTSNGIAFTIYCLALGHSTVEVVGVTYANGTVTGQRWVAQGLSLINTQGKGENYFPGTVDGATQTGGVYA